MGYRVLPVLISLTVTLGLLGSTWWLDARERSRTAHQERAEITVKLGAIRARLESSLDQRLALVQGLAAYARTHLAAGIALDEAGFRTFARELQGSQGGIRSLQLAPRAVVKYVYPYAGNEVVIGHDLLADPERRESVQRAIDRKAYVISGPVTLLQGGVALIGRLPIYHYPHDAEEFWGFATILLDVEPIWAEAGLNAPGEGLQVALRGKGGLGSAGDLIMGELGLFDQRPVTAQVSLPYGSWQLAAIPAHGWGGRSPWSWTFVLGAAMACLAGAFTYYLLRTPAKIQARLVESDRAHQRELTALGQQLAQMQAVMDSLPDLVFCKDDLGRYLCCNEAFSRYIGLGRAQLIGLSDAELFSEGHPAIFHGAPVERLVLGEQRRAEEWVTFSDGRSVLLETLKVPFVDSGGRQCGIIGISRDSTDRKWIEQTLQASERRYREMIEGLADALFRISVPDGHFEYLSPATARVFGWKPERFEENPLFITECIHPDDLEAFAGYWRGLLAGAPAPTFEYSILDADGQRRWIMQSARVVCDEQGAPAAVEGISRDVTQEKQIDRILKKISDGVSQSVGDAFFKDLVRSLAEALHVEQVFIAGHHAGQASMETLAVYADGGDRENFEYQLHGTPCAEVLARGAMVVERGVTTAYPEDERLRRFEATSYAGTRLSNAQGQPIGVLGLQGRSPLLNEQYVRAALGIIAARAAAELERIEQDRLVRMLSCAVTQSPTAVLITDSEGAIEFANQSFCRISGYEAAELIGQNPRVLKSNRQAPAFYEELWSTIVSGREWHGELINRRKDGQLYWARSSIYPICLEPEGVTSFVLLKQDVSEEKQKDAKLKLASTVFDTTSEAIVVTNSDNRIQMVNPAFTRISGYAPEEVIGKDPGILSSGHHDESFYREMQQRLDREHCWAGEIWNRRKNGEMFPEWLSIVKVFDDFGALEHYVAVFSDISKRKETEGLLYQQANFDALTGLPNRLLAADRLHSALGRARRLKTRVAVLHIDLDRFKSVNDTYGHDAGDALLKDTAARLTEVVGETDTVARLGGDEFLMLLPELGSGFDAEHIASAIGHRLSKAFQLSEGQAYLTASVGVAVFPEDGASAEALLQHADTAMGRAKAGGGNSCCFFTANMNDEVRLRAKLEADLRLAILNEEFEVFYQPLIDAHRRVVFGAEALVRWRHPENGLVMPGAFIPLAEETGLIVAIGSWVLKQVCGQLNRWQEQGGPALRVSVNLSPKQCLEERGLEQVRGILRQTGVDADSLVLEITESMLMQEDTALHALRQLRGMGVRLALDDFGTGYSSLSYLKRFPIDILKIDRSFVQDLPGDRGDAALVEAIVAMARSLDLDVVAEGVETEAQKHFLSELSCSYIQGFFFAKPMDLIAFEDFVKQYNA